MDKHHSLVKPTEKAGTSGPVIRPMGKTLLPYLRVLPIEIPRSRPCSLLSKEGCIYTKWQGDYESSSLLVKPCLLDQGKGWLGSVVWG